MQKEKLLTKFGFSFSRGGVHSSRTIMTEDLELLFDTVSDPAALKDKYFSAIVEDNCLKKRSVKTRNLSARHLADLYALDPSVALFRVLQFFWQRDKPGRPLIALLCAYARDSILRSTAPYILDLPEGNTVHREAVEAFIDSRESDRFSKATLKSVAQNINASFTKSGHILGKVKKTRARANPTPGAAAYSLLLGYLTGLRGESLLQSEYTRLLDCSAQRTIELAEIASQKGWIVFKRIGNVMELLFPNLLTKQEMDWIREQN